MKYFPIDIEASFTNTFRECVEPELSARPNLAASPVPSLSFSPFIVNRLPLLKTVTAQEKHEGKKRDFNDR
jgi:hypothetical protein